MTSDENTIEKKFERMIFNKAKADPIMQKHVARLEVVVLRENEEEVSVRFYGQLKKGTYVDTITTKTELSVGWRKSKNLEEIADRLVESQVESLKMTIQSFKKEKPQKATMNESQVKEVVAKKLKLDKATKLMPVKQKPKKSAFNELAYFLGK